MNRANDGNLRIAAAGPVGGRLTSPPPSLFSSGVTAMAWSFCPFRKGRPDSMALTPCEAAVGPTSICCPYGQLLVCYAL